MAVDALDFFEYDEYLKRNEEDAFFNSVFEPSRRYLRDIEDPLEYYTNVQFKKRYRFEKETVLVMMKTLHITERLQRCSRQGLPLPPLIQFVCALRIYASGSFQTVLGDLRKIHQSTVSRSLHQVTRIIAEQLGNVVRFPDVRGQAANSARFLRDTGLAEVLGAVDATHVSIHNPGGARSEEFLNARRYYSLNVQIVSGPRCEILDVVARWPGGARDALVFEGSGVRARLEAGGLRGHLVGDAAYPSRPYLVTPATQGISGDAHSRALHTVRRCVADMKRRLLCLKKGLAYSPDKVSAIVCACAVLHNVAVATNDPVPDDEDA